MVEPRIYIAGAIKELDRVKAVASALEPHYVITHRWWDGLETEPHDASKEDKARWAREDLAAVERADCVAVLWPESQTGSAGLKIELGYALATTNASRIHISGPSRSIFTALCNVYSQDADMISALLRGET